MARCAARSSSTSASAPASTPASRPTATSPDPDALSARRPAPRRGRRRTPGRPPRRDRERYWLSTGARVVAGLDEVGRGPLAGPVVAAAVVLPAGVQVRGARDSKLLEPEVRVRLDRVIRSRAAAVSVAAVSPQLIDRLNILEASRLAMRLAVEGLDPAPDMALIDGTPLPVFPCTHEAIVGGDARELSIACASIVAKVARDAMMELYDGLYPGYGFSRHKGYHTPEHLEALRRRGPSPIHRWSFSPVRQPSLFAAAP